jgi:hypothetical protein
MNDNMTKELEEWLNDWSAKLDSVEAKLEKEVFSFNLLEKYTSFLLKISSFPHKHFFIAEDEVADGEEE